MAACMVTLPRAYFYFIHSMFGTKISAKNNKSSILALLKNHMGPYTMWPTVPRGNICQALSSG